MSRLTVHFIDTFEMNTNNRKIGDVYKLDVYFNFVFILY